MGRRAEGNLPPVLEKYEREDADYNSGISEYLGGAEDGVPGLGVGDSRDLAEALQRR